MSDLPPFNQFLAEAWDFAASDSIGMGQDAVLDGTNVTIIADGLHRTSVANPRGGGRLIEISGIVTISHEQWNAAGGHQGSTLEIPSLNGVTLNATTRVTNTPNLALSVVTLEISGTAQT